MASVNVGRLGVVLALNSAEFVQGLGKATSQLAAFANKAKPAILGVGAAMAALVAKAVAYADEVSDLASANEVMISTVVNLGSALQASGGRSDQAGRLLSSFTAKVDEAAQGSKGAQEAFSRLGISLSDIASKDNQELLDLTVKKLAEMQDPIQRNALGAQIFGRALKGVDITNFAKQLSEAKLLTEEQVQAFKDAGDAADAMAYSWKTFLTKTVSEVGTKLKDVIDYLSELESVSFVVNAAIKLLGAAFDIVVLALANIEFVVVQVVKGFKLLYDITKNPLDAKNLFKSYNEEAEKAREKLDALTEKLLNPATPSGKTEKKPESVAKREVLDADAEAVKKAQEISREYENQLKLAQKQLERKGELIKLTEREREVAEALGKIDDDRQKKIDDINKQIASEQAKNKPNEKAIAALKEQIPLVEKLAEEYAKLTEATIRSQQEAERTFEFGFKKAFDDYIENAENAANRGREAFQTFASAAEDALDQFVKTGKVNFAELTRSIIQDLLKIEIKQRALALYQGAGGGSGIISGIKSIFGFAEGGDPPTGKPYLVGERGPEIRVDKSPSRIIPMQALQREENSSNNGLTVNGPYIAQMSAIDTQSALQFLGNNKEGIWGAYQQAAKGKVAGRYF